MSAKTAEFIAWINGSSAADFWFWLILLAILATILFFSSYTNLHRKRLIEDIPTSKIRSAAQGYVEFIGHGYLMEGVPIVSPITGKHCLWYDYRIEEMQNRNNKSEWRTIKKGTSDELFLIRDETGQCIIDPEKANVTVTDKSVWYGQSAMPVSGPTASNSKKSFLSLSGISTSGRFRYTERLLYSGQPLYAIGMYKTIGGAGATYDVNEDVRELIREWKTDTQQLMKQFDTNNDGELDLNEWQQVRKQAEKLVMAKHSEQKNLPAVHLLEQTGDKRRPFILSDVEQDDLTRKLHYYALASVSGFLLFGSIVIWMLSVRLAA